MTKRIPEYQPYNFKAIINVEHPNTRKNFNNFFIEPLSVLEERAIMPSISHRKPVNDFVLVGHGSLEKMVCADVFKLRGKTLMLLPAYKIRYIIKITKDIQGY